MFRASLWRFAESVGSILSEAESDIQRTIMWLETEQSAHWENEIRRRAEAVSKAKDAVRAKTLFKAKGVSRASAVEEQKALRLAIARLEEANAKREAVRRDARRLHKELLIYRGQVQRLASVVSLDIPAAVNHLDNLVGWLDAYTRPVLPGASEEHVTLPVEEVRPEDQQTGSPPAEPKQERG